MNLWENIHLAISGLRSAKMRSLLTMLGIIIGISSVIAIVTIGNAMQSAVTDQMSSFGLKNIEIGLYSKSGTWTNISDTDRISMDQIERFAERFQGRITAYSMSQNAGFGTAKDGRKYANVRVTGVNDGYAVAQNFELQRGRFLTLRDVKGSKNVAVVSDKLATNLFGEGVNPLGQEIKVHLQNEIITFGIVGTYKYEPSPYEFSTASDKDITTQMYIPITTAQKLTASTLRYEYFTATVADGINPMDISAEIEEYFEKEYSKNKRYGIYAYSMESYLDEMTNMMGTMQIAISIIAGISLLVGGIGVMNIMLVSVTERTREIGTRKALGARNSAIRVQFIVESMIICLIGGIIGIFLGLCLGYLGSSLLRFPASPSVPIIVIAVLFSMAIGVFFGYYPANKAAKLDPIEALRYE